MNIFDQQTDTSRKYLYQAASQLADESFQAQVKKLAEAPTDSTKLASERFAWPEKRLFPVDSMANTVVSKVYFDAQREKLLDKTADEIATRLDTFLNLYDIPEAEFARISEKTAGSGFEPRYLVPSMKLCKVAGAESLRKAGDLFEKEHKKLKIAQRVEFSQNFVSAGRELKEKDFPKAVAKYACMLDTDLSNTEHMLRLRASAARLRGQNGAEYLKLAEQIGEVTNKPETDELRKLAECIRQLDDRHGFDSRRYREKLPCPYSVVFNKQATQVPDAALDADTMTKADIVARFGEEALDALEDENGKIDKDKLRQFISMQKGSIEDA